MWDIHLILTELRILDKTLYREIHRHITMYIYTPRKNLICCHISVMHRRDHTQRTSSSVTLNTKFKTAFRKEIEKIQSNSEESKATLTAGSCFVSIQKPKLLPFIFILIGAGFLLRKAVLLQSSVLSSDFDTVIFYNTHATFNDLVSTLLQAEFAMRTFPQVPLIY